MLDYSVLRICFQIMAFLFAISLHEYAHGAMANRLGDPTARYMGRLTLNPLRHIDLFGALTLILTNFRFGWAKPVPINPNNFKNPRQGMMYTGLAGPLANLAAALCFALTVRILGLAPLSGTLPGEIFGYFLYYNVLLNVGLAIFNLLPLPPLDGSKILLGLLPARYGWRFEQFDQYGPLILLFLVWTGVLVRIINPLYQVVIRVLLG
jgi:Zn-dependent protease